MITADVEFARDDENNYRIALIDAFRSWGIFPEQVNTLSEESLQWSSPNLTGVELDALRLTADFLKDRVRELTNITDRRQIWLQSQDIQRDLHNFLLSRKKPALGETNWEQWLNKLGLTSQRIDLADVPELNIDNNRIPLLEVHKVRPAYRVGKQGLVLEQIIVSITQSVSVSLVDDPNQRIRFRGGSTIIFDRSKDFSLSYIITKNINSRTRLVAQLDYQQGSSEESMSFTDSMYEENNGLDTINFAHLHFH